MPRVNRHRPNVGAVTVEHDVWPVLVVNFPDVAPVRAHDDVGGVEVAVEGTNRGRAVAVVGVEDAGGVRLARDGFSPSRGGELRRGPPHDRTVPAAAHQRLAVVTQGEASHAAERDAAAGELGNLRPRAVRLELAGAV